MNNNALSAHQRELLKKSSISPAQILDNLDDLNEEIAESYDQQIAQEVAAKDVTLKVPSKPVLNNTHKTTVKKIEDVVMVEETEDLDAKLEEEVKAAELLAARKAKREAAEAAQKAKEAGTPPEEELSPVEQQKKAIMELLARTPGAPTPQQIDGLKAKYGEDGINVLALGESDIYIFTYLRRGQWQNIQKLVQAAQSSEVGGNPDEILKEKVIQYTVLWPKGVSSPEFLYNSRAGVTDTLYQTILMHSYFLSPQQAMMLTTQI